MGTSAYLRDSTAELLDAIEEELPLENKASIIHRALEVYADTLFDLSSSDTLNVEGTLSKQEIRQSAGVTKQARVRYFSDEGRIHAPKFVGNHKQEQCQYECNQSNEIEEVHIRYRSESSLWVLRNSPSNEEEFSLGCLEDGELITSEKFTDIRPAIARLNAELLALPETLLTVREYEVWWLTRANSHEQVAEWLNIGQETVNTHLSNISEKRQTAEQTLSLLGGRISVDGQTN